MKGYALKKWESTLNLCVHAHGPDVELIMEAARKNNYSFGISHLISGIWPFAIVVPTMFSFKYHFSCKFKHLSSAEQYPSPTSTLICRRALPPGISRLSRNRITSYEFFIKCYILIDSKFSRALSF